MSRNVSRRAVLKAAALGMAAVGLPLKPPELEAANVDDGFATFVRPPDDAKPWVYWYFMDGNLTRNGIEADLIAMKNAGIGGAIYLEVGIGIRPGPVSFMSEQWQQLLSYAFSEADRLGLKLSLAAGPGWCGAGGPWVKPDQSMQHLVFSRTDLNGPTDFDAKLEQPQPRKPFFGVDTLSPELFKLWKDFYRDEFVLAFPTPVVGASIRDIDEKALYTRGSYSSQIPGPYTRNPWVRPFLPSDDSYPTVPIEECVASGKVVNLSGNLRPDGSLFWTVPPGRWTILRLGRTLTGQTTRPAPKPGLGLETDKFSAAAIDAHFDAYILPLIKRSGAAQHPGRGLTALHYDSWEMSSQNWSPGFQEEFKSRRRYDPTTMLPAFTGMVVDSLEISERFLWDIRQTAQELVCQNQTLRLRTRGQRHGLILELEPYDLNPCGDLRLGSTADLPMGEFWSKTADAPPTDFSVAEAVSVGHTEGHKIIGAEAFTATMAEKGLQHPASMKARGDWAFCQGINRYYIHRYQAQPWLDRFPGMTMGMDGGYGVHWERTQTWWDFVPAYHLYLSRCQHMLRCGLAVADILYLNPEGAPSVFFPPRSAFRPGLFADRRGYNFDGCSPDTLIRRATVANGRIVFPDGMSYAILVLPRFRTMTPRLLTKIVELVEAGATVFGAPPDKSPSLENYPDCDRRVRELANRLWPAGEKHTERRIGQGRVIFDAGAVRHRPTNPLSEAQWIWRALPDGVAPGTDLYFHREFSVDNPDSIETAEVAITADQSYELSLNGRFILGSDPSGTSIEDVRRVRRVDISALLRCGINRFTVAVKKNTNKTRQSGLIASLRLRSLAGTTRGICSDHRWTCSLAKSGPQSPATQLGSYNMPPWNLNEASMEQEDIYPSYAATARLLERMGFKSDLETEVPFRHTHRRDGNDDFYFIANGETKEQSGICTFRAAGRQPEWWNPISGERCDLTQFSQTGERTQIPIRLKPLESGFVVFRKPIAKSHVLPGMSFEGNFPAMETVVTFSEPWQVAFDPKWGGPARATFSRLEDWAKRPEPGIRSYSGKATYRTNFDCREMDPDRRYFLSLGKVAVIASVKLNGSDLGVAWCEPWRTAIPASVLRPRGNALEIVVANLWVNRLITDSGLPQDRRLTWTTSNPFHPDDPLLESGLLGPVVLQAETRRAN